MKSGLAHSSFVTGGADYDEKNQIRDIANDKRDDRVF